MLANSDLCVEIGEIWLEYVYLIFSPSTSSKIISKDFMCSVFKLTQEKSMKERNLPFPTPCFFYVMEVITFTLNFLSVPSTDIMPPHQNLDDINGSLAKGKLTHRNGSLNNNPEGKEALKDRNLGHVNLKKRVGLLSGVCLIVGTMIGQWCSLLLL